MICGTQGSHRSLEHRSLPMSCLGLVDKYLALARPCGAVWSPVDFLAAAILGFLQCVSLLLHAQSKRERPRKRWEKSQQSSLWEGVLRLPFLNHYGNTELQQQRELRQLPPASFVIPEMSMADKGHTATW